MEEITLNPEQMDYLIDQLSHTSAFDVFQMVVGALTVGALIWTLALQRKNTRIIVDDHRISMMPYFDIYRIGTKDNIKDRMIRVNHAVAYNVKFASKHATYFAEGFNLNFQRDVVSPGTKYEYRPNAISVAAVNKITKSNEPVEILKIYFTDFAGRKYYQVVHFHLGESNILKPVLIN